MKLFFAILAVIIGIIIAPMFLSPAPDNAGGQAVTGLPWQIETLPEGKSKVFGLTLGDSTLEDARSRFGDSEIALIAEPGQLPTLEMYINNATVGDALLGKMIVTGELPETSIAAMRERAIKTEYMQSTTRRSTLAEADRAAAYAAPIGGLAFVPSINLDEAMIIQRFGTPAERIRSSAKIEHLLYPDRGLDIVFDSDGKEVLQYVAPARFARLREPLLKAAAETTATTTPPASTNSGGSR